MRKIKYESLCGFVLCISQVPPEGKNGGGADELIVVLLVQQICLEVRTVLLQLAVVHVD